MFLFPSRVEVRDHPTRWYIDRSVLFCVGDRDQLFAIPMSRGFGHRLRRTVCARC